MKCDKCSNQAVYHSTVIINGNSQSTHLCEECAKKEGVFNQTNQFFDDFFESFNNFMPGNSLFDILCPSCSSSFVDFRKNHYLGCEDCYSTFRNRAEDFINSNKEMDNKIEFRTPQKTKEDVEIEKLTSQLNKAIQEERYEDASDINKKIKAIKNKAKGE